MSQPFKFFLAFGLSLVLFTSSVLAVEPANEATNTTLEAIEVKEEVPSSENGLLETVEKEIGPVDVVDEQVQSIQDSEKGNLSEVQIQAPELPTATPQVTTPSAIKVPTLPVPSVVVTQQLFKVTDYQGQITDYLIVTLSAGEKIVALLDASGVIFSEGITHEEMDQVKISSLSGKGVLKGFKWQFAPVAVEPVFIPSICEPVVAPSNPEPAKTDESIQVDEAVQTEESTQVEEAIETEDFTPSESSETLVEELVETEAETEEIYEVSQQK